MVGQEWEYRIETFADFGNLAESARRERIEARLNDWGAEGWELVTAATGPAGGAAHIYSLIFKRPKGTDFPPARVFAPDAADLGE